MTATPELNPSLRASGKSPTSQRRDAFGADAARPWPLRYQRRPRPTHPHRNPSPQPGIQFYDITTILLDPPCFQHCVDLMVERFREMGGVTAVAGLEARGFIFGPPVALALGVPFVPFRKPKKLPGPTVGVDYALEYGTDRIEAHVGALKEGDKVALVDDLLATGGTLAAGMALCKALGAEPAGAAVVVELPALAGRRKLEGMPTFSILAKEGE